MEFFEEIITSGQNKYVSEARMLDEKKRRDSSRLFRFDGVKLLCEAILSGVELEYLLISDEKYESVFEKTKQTYNICREDMPCRVIPVKQSVFEKISSEKAPEGVICVAKYIDKFHKFVKINNEGNFSYEMSVSQDERVLLLESVRDPQNIGAIIRSAAAMGADRIIMSADCADIYNSKTVRAAMGTLFRMKIDRVDSIPEAIRCLQADGRKVFAAALDDKAQRLGQATISPLDCILIGNEGHGLTSEAIQACDSTLYIPMKSGVESLNAAVAASVLLWEFFGRG